MTPEPLQLFCLGLADLLSVYHRVSADDGESIILAMSRIVSAVADDTEAHP